MKQFTITIPDNKESIFIEWMKSISFVKKIEAVEKSDLPEWHKAILDERLASYKSSPGNVIDLDKACKDIEKEL